MAFQTFFFLFDRFSLLCGEVSGEDGKRELVGSLLYFGFVRTVVVAVLTLRAGKFCIFVIEVFCNNRPTPWTITSKGVEIIGGEGFYSSLGCSLLLFVCRRLSATNTTPAPFIITIPLFHYHPQAEIGIISLVNQIIYCFIFFVHQLLIEACNSCCGVC